MPLIPNRSLKYNDHGKTSMLTGRTTLGGPTLEQNSHPEQGSWAQSCGAHLTSSLPSSLPTLATPLFCSQWRIYFFSVLPLGIWEQTAQVSPGLVLIRARTRGYLVIMGNYEVQTPPPEVSCGKMAQDPLP